MPTLLQINVTANSGSTGRIAEQINQVARLQGWKTYFAYGRNMRPCESELIRVGNQFQVYEHYAEHRLFDNDGRASRMATKRLIRTIKSIGPDIIHLHNIHDHWLNYEVLFNYLRTAHIPVVWTQHDCWAFTGGCCHFTLRGCYRWKVGEGCTERCPARQHLRMPRLLEKTSLHYRKKLELFTSVDNMTIVPVSYWLEGLVKQSYLNCHAVTTIHNGVDVSLFHPVDSESVRKKYGIEEGAYVIGVSGVWLPYKGWYDYLKLATLLPDKVKLVLVGLNDKQLEEAAKVGIVGIPRTENIEELAELYSGAMVTLNLSREESFGLTTVEGFSCGTPGIVYNSTASPELIIDNYDYSTQEPVRGYYTGQTGWIVEQGDVRTVSDIIDNWNNVISKDTLAEKEMRRKCRERAVKEFNKEDRFAEYMDLYRGLLHQ